MAEQLDWDSLPGNAANSINDLEQEVSEMCDALDHETEPYDDISIVIDKLMAVIRHANEALSELRK